MHQTMYLTGSYFRLEVLALDMFRSGKTENFEKDY